MRVLLPSALLLALLVISAHGGGSYDRDRDDDDDDHHDRDPCDMDKDDGDCHEHHRRFFFDKRSKFCKSFTHKGCRKNENNFRSREDCYKRCDKKTERCSDDDTMYHKAKIQMTNPFSFYKQHKEEYERKFKEAVAAQLPMSTKEVKILEVKEGSTILYIEIQRSFLDDSFKTFLKKVQSGAFTFKVAGTDIKSTPNQDPMPETHDGPRRRGRRCRKIALIVGLVVLAIGLIVGITIVVKVMKKKKMRASPIDTAKNAFQTVWNSDSPESVTTEKKQPPPEYDVTNFNPYPATVPAYEAQAPPAYESPAPPYAPEPAGDSYPTKSPDEVPA